MVCISIAHYMSAATRRRFYIGLNVPYSAIVQIAACLVFYCYIKRSEKRRKIRHKDTANSQMDGIQAAIDGEFVSWIREASATDGDGFFAFVGAFDVAFC